MNASDGASRGTRVGSPRYAAWECSAGGVFLAAGSASLPWTAAGIFRLLCATDSRLLSDDKSRSFGRGARTRGVVGQDAARGARALRALPECGRTELGPPVAEPVLFLRVRGRTTGERDAVC